MPILAVHELRLKLDSIGTQMTQIELIFADVTKINLL